MIRRRHRCAPFGAGRHAYGCLAGLLLVLVASAASADDAAPPPSARNVASDADDWRSRSRLTGDWGGRRAALEERGLSIAMDATYTFQAVVAGGLDGPVFRAVSDEDETGNIVSGDLQLAFDTGKAGWWHGGTLESRLEGRAGRSVLQRAGTISAVDNDAVFPNVVDRFDEEALALTKLSFTQYLGERFALFGGLLDTAEGDQNALAGSALSNERFLNSALLYSLVEDATAPNVALGGGVLVEPRPNVSASFSAFGTEETAGEDPFQHTEGVTFAFEATVGHMLAARSGAQTFGFLYGIDARRVAIANDPRLVLASVLRDRGVPETSADTWAVYYNAHQILWGDEDRGSGVFVRLGLSDGDPNPVRWNWAGGLGGRGLVPRRPADVWGVGAFYLGLSNADLLKGLNVGDEIGGEVFYEVALTPWLHVTLDLQVVDPALPRADTACMLAVRSRVEL
jgi:porin